MKFFRLSAKSPAENFHNMISKFFRFGKSPIAFLLAGFCGLSIYFASGQTSGNGGAIKPGDYEPNLPIVFLEAKNRIVSEQKVPCTVKISYPKGGESRLTNTLPGVVRIHGASSQMYPKKSFGVTLAAPAPLLGMRESVHWVLNAAFIDRSLMRHKLAYDLFRLLSTPQAKRFASGSRFIEVYLNDRYLGVYLLMERVDRQLLELRTYNSNDVSHACIYKAIDHAANFGHAGNAGYEQREPDPLVKAYWQPLNDFNRFISSAPDAEFFNPKTGIVSRLDLDNAIDFHLLVLVTSNKDGITKNFNLARNAPSAGSLAPRFFFSPWDYDATFGQDWNAHPLHPHLWLSNHLFDRLLSDKSYREKFVARWDQLRGKEFSAKSVQNLIETNARTVGAAARRNAMRWSVGDRYFPIRLSFAEDVAQMKSWMELRVKWLDQEIHRRYGTTTN